MRDTIETSRNTIAHEISEHPFLRGLSSDFLDRASRSATSRTYATDEYLLHEGEEAKHLFLIYSGKVALEVAPPGRSSLTIETAEKGDIVGWSWSVPPRRYGHNARALKPTRAIALEAQVLRAACEEDPNDGYRFIIRLLAVVADRLANTRLQLVNTYRD